MVTTVQSMATQQIRIKKESVYGTPPAAIDRKLNALRIVPHKMIEAEGFAGSGDTAISLVSINDNYTTISVRGKLAFNDLMWILGSIIGGTSPALVTSTPVGATLTRRHVFTWDGRTPIVPNSYTIHYGTADRARQVPGVIFNGLTFSAARDGNIEMTSGGFGKRLVAGVTGASTPPFASVLTEIPAIPIFATYFDVFIDDVWADLGDTQQLQLYTFGLNMADRVGRARPLTRTGVSDGVVESENQTHTVNMQLLADATGEAFLTDADEGNMKFIRMSAIAPDDSIEAGFEYSVTLDLCVIINEVGEYSSVQGGVHVLPFTAQIARDPVSGFAMIATVDNVLAGIT